MGKTISRKCWDSDLFIISLVAEMADILKNTFREYSQYFVIIPMECSLKIG